MMKCSFDSTGTLGTLYEAAVVFVAMSVSLFLISIGDYYRFSTLMAVSAIILIVFAVAAVVLLNIKGGVIHAKSEKLIITHSLASRKIFVSRISYEDIEYADHNVTQKRSRLGFYCYVFELIIHMKSGKKIKLCVDLNIPQYSRRQAHVRPRRLQAVYKRSAYYEALQIYKRKIKIKINLKGGGISEADRYRLIQKPIKMSIQTNI